MEEFFEKNCKIESNKQFGRYVKAKYDLRVGDCLLMEQPSLLMASNGEMRCQNCFYLTRDFCKVCFITPLCDKCKQHYSYDCQKFTNISDIDIKVVQKFPDIYGILKFLLLQDNPETQEHFYTILQAENHLEKRRDTKIWQYYTDNVIEPILKSEILKCLSNGANINAEFLHSLCALIDVNSFEIRAPDTGSMKGVYVKGALLSHDCVANTCIAIDDKYCMKIYANRSIECDEVVTNCYTNILLNTINRKKVLLEGKYFNCTCQRCEDPTELGSHMSSVKCTSSTCLNGYMIKSRNEKEKWQCLECKHQESSEVVNNMLKQLQSNVSERPKSLPELEIQLQKLQTQLHPQHYLIIDVKQNIASVLRAIINDISCCPGRKVYERKIDLCRDILKVLQIIAPGLSRLKAIAVYELGSAIAEYNRMLYQKKELNKNDLRELLQESEKMLREAIHMLLYEPKETPEGKLLLSMLHELKYLQTDVKMLK